MDKIVLNNEKETLLIPLYGKAMENKKKNPIIFDRKAKEIVDKIDYDFKSLKIPEKTNMMMCIRAKLLDDLVLDFLKSKKSAIALHLGCGLDSRYLRIDDKNVNWFDVDFKEVIDLRKEFYIETDKYHLVSSSVTESSWIDELPSYTDTEPCIVIAEGLFMYLKEDEIKILIERLKNKFISFYLIFDAFSLETVKRMDRYPSLKKTGAKIHWGIDDPREFLKLGENIYFEGEKYISSNDEIKKLSNLNKILFKIAHSFPQVRKAHRILIYKVGLLK